VPQLSEQQQAQAQQETMAAQRQLTQQGQQAAAATGAAEQQLETQVRQQRKRLNEREVGLREQAAQKVDEVLTNYVQKKGEMDLAKDRAQAEQVGFMLRLSSEQYVERLRIEGSKARLNDRINFTEALQRAMFDEERKLLDENLRFKRLIGATERDFKEQVAEIDIESALAIAGARAQGANAAMKAEAISGIVSGAAKTGSAIYDKMPAKTTSPGTANATASAYQPTGFNYDEPYDAAQSQSQLQQSWGIETTEPFSLARPQGG
jgi:hypothetical protein